MAGVALDQILGGTKLMSPSIDMSTQLKLVGTEVASFGDPFIEGESAIPIRYENKQRGIYKRINISKDGSKLLGGILVGDSADYNALFQLYINEMKLPENAEDLILGQRGSGSKSLLGSVLDLPDSAQICSCESVNKGSICEALKSGACTDLKGVIQQTKASTCCGGCKPMVVDLVKETMKSLGKEVKETICEHFEYSRQELFDLVKLNNTSGYNEALDQFGKGHGCEICKPVMASIFASIFMETANKQIAIQDSNDRFLANIQRNGTYSVVPRVPGGEITPEKLVVLGQVARKYDLYTKITGGQRIDLFGAKLNELPLIWKELIDAGFESGHAYGKSLRTVKSCVGSTWCRFGMHDSVSFAIRIEERYKGLRSPHKLKGGVSGCIRECAEARSKDFGVIAVEGGWNLYVCGNGGANPKHAILLASQLDDDTCIKYLDRFLIYYIRTAGPLIRTSTWLEKLEGGIEYLRKVVVEDCLGMAEEFENDMDGLVEKYTCEWKEAIENPETLKRFKPFVNSEESDDQLVFVPLREQKNAQTLVTPNLAPMEEIVSLYQTVQFSEVISWIKVGTVTDFPENAGACIKHNSRQIAVYHFTRTQKWYACQNLCPHKMEMVLSRGLIGDMSGVPKLACPMHKKTFSLEDGSNLNGEDYSIATYPVKIEDGIVYIGFAE
ncbi:nitrite reductase large subunit NirB [Algoriphagus boritolerans]|uniref:nitrite reductase large subunit NirB n=2 Tax=Algoriphagus boritolerans TaxID=308111 RepID=UPI000A9F0D40